MLFLGLDNLFSIHLDRNTGPFRQLQLTLVWDRADLARELVLSNKIKWEVSIKVFLALEKKNIK